MGAVETTESSCVPFEPSVGCLSPTALFTAVLHMSISEVNVAFKKKKLWSTSDMMDISPHQWHHKAYSISGSGKQTYDSASALAMTGAKTYQQLKQTTIHSKNGAIK